MSYAWLIGVVIGSDIKWYKTMIRTHAWLIGVVIDSDIKWYKTMIRTHSWKLACKERVFKSL